MAESIWSFPELYRAFADDALLPLDRYPDEIVEKFFVSRDLEAATLLSRIDEILRFGGNIMVVGDRGVGKSSFLKWFLARSGVSSHLSGHHVTVIDLKEKPVSTDLPSFMEMVHEELIRATKQYLADVHDNPCNDLIDMEVAHDWNRAYRRVTSHLTQSQKNSHKMLLFVDDIDYVSPNFFLELLSQLKPYLASPNACAIVAARKPAANAIGSHADSTISQFFQPASRVELSHLSLQQVLGARLEYFQSRGPSLREIFVSYGSDLLADLAAICVDKEPLGACSVEGFPFTDKQVSFIQETTNGNIKEMLSLSCHVLKYIGHNASQLARTDAGAFEIGRERLIREFSNAEYGSVSLVNLHKRKSHHSISEAARKRDRIPPEQIGNSLYVCILECLEDYGSLNESQQLALERFGFSRTELREGVAELIEMGMMEESR